MNVDGKNVCRFARARARVCVCSFAGVTAQAGRELCSNAGDGLHQGRWVFSCRDLTRDNARVVSTPRLCIASDTRNSRILDRKTARPSPPRQKGVLPPPFSCNSQRLPLSNLTCSNMETENST